MPPSVSEDLLVGIETSDDAAVVRLRPDLAALLTVDFFTPIVDDPFDFGRIAAANSLSDIYAMGGRPLAALNLLALPASLPAEVGAAIVRGGAEVVHAAGALIVGGHTIEDPEPKYGLCVLGTADPSEIVRNVGAVAGDALVLTKRIGVGIMTTALKRGLRTEESMRPVIEDMARLNESAGRAMTRVGVSAATDVTGFGLIGHLHEMMAGSGVSAVIDSASVPVWDGALDFAADMVCPGRTKDLLAYVEATTDWGALPVEWHIVLTDPQTSGGLLIAVGADRADALLAELASGGDQAAVIGKVRAGAPGFVTVT